jgi:tRNA A-37 threonylcarbamoyl transferase component Bud32
MLENTFGGLVFIGKFQSRKNAVYLVERDGRRLVLKLYENDRWRVEADVLREALTAGIAVPETVEMRERAILMEFIEGRPANDYLETERMDEMALGVAGWLAGFHTAFRHGDLVRLKSDAIFRNFIVSDRIYGLDFELSRMGRPEEDVGEALAYLLDTDPMFTPEKFRLGMSFIERYEKESGIALQNIEEYVARSLREASEFRRSPEFLIKKAAEIEADRPFRRGR